MDMVGSRLPRLDGVDKVTGKAIYVDDITMDGMLHGRTVRSTQAHARLDAIVWDPEFDWSNIVRVTAKDIEALGGENVVHLIENDQPCLADALITHPDEPVALIAAPTPELANEALKHVTLKTTPLPPVFDMEASEKLAGRILNMSQGDLDAGFARSDHIIEGRYYTGPQEQMYIEVQGMLAIPTENGITIKGSLQCPYYVHRAIKRLFKMDDSQVTIIQTVTGGGFGGKEEYPSMIAGHTALLAKISGKPVKLIYDRSEDLRATTKRHASIVTHKTGVMSDGTLVCTDIDVMFDAGAYVTLSPVVLSRGILHAAGPYRFDAVRVVGRNKITNTPPAGAFRGFGAPQVTFAYERHMDLIARTLGKDPLEFRLQNALKIGDVLPTGQVLKDSFGGDAVLKACLEKSRYVERRQAPRDVGAAERGERIRRGIGLSYFLHGAGFTGNGEAYLKGKVALEITTSGAIRIRTASTDIGQGVVTIFPQIASDTLGIPVDRIEMAQPDTSQVPDSGPTVASRTTMVVGKVVQEAAQTILEKLQQYRPDLSIADAATAWGAEHGVFRVDATFKSPPNLEWDTETYQGDAYPCFGWACDVVEVEVDLDTGEVKITDFVTAQDAGKVIHPVLAEGQIEGGSLQALGFAVMEEVVVRDGAMINDRMTNYIIPTSLDAPEMDVTLVEEPYDYGPFGAKGIGEMPMDGGAPAVFSAIEHAIDGVVPDHCPLMPERLLPALEKCS